MSHASYLTVGEVWDSVRPYWRRFPRWVRWSLVFVSIIILVVEPRLPFWIFGGGVLIGGILMFKTPLLSAVSLYYRDSEKQKPFTLIAVDWATKPFRLMDSVPELLEGAYEHLFGKR